MKHLRDFVSSVPEYRRTGKGNFRHKLEDMLMLVILGRLSKCITRADILQFGKQHLKRLQSQGMFRHGLPSEATLCRVSQGIDDEKMAGCLAAFAEIFRKEAAVPGLAEIICIDGKATRGTLYGNGRTPNIVSAYSPDLGLTLATDACEEKSNEIKSVPVLLDKLDISGHVITADAMSFQKAIIDKIKGKGGDFVIELKANQRSLRYGLEDAIKDAKLTVIEICTTTEKKSDGRRASERRLYVSSLDCGAERLSLITRRHWAIESMHWDLDRNLQQDRIKRKTERAARNLDTIQRMVLALIAVWKNRRKKLSDKRKGTAEITRELSMNFTKVLCFLSQK